VIDFFVESLLILSPDLEKRYAFLPCEIMTNILTESPAGQQGFLEKVNI
jgi:hypothetical protein